jgi:hypothetical protein
MRICDLIRNQDTYQANIGQTVLETGRAVGGRPALRLDSILLWEDLSYTYSPSGQPLIFPPAISF